MRAVEQQFRRMAFNIVARNQDDHVKNIAFLMDRAGNWSLAPAFDVTYSYNPAGAWTASHQMTLNGKRDGFELDDFIACAKAGSMKRGRAAAILDEVRKTVSCWRDYAEQAGVDPAQAGQIQLFHSRLTILGQAPRLNMTMWKFIHAADIHLDSSLHGLERYEGAPVEEIRRATRRALDNLIELAIDEAVAFVLLVGDLYDGDWRDYNTGLYFVERMGRLRDAGIRVFIVAGNHDAASQITRHLRLPDNVTLFSTRNPEQVILDDLNVAVYGQGFATRAVTDDLSQAYPQGDPQFLNIGLLHTCLDGKPGHEPYAPCTVDGLRSKGYQYWALGHVHKREEVSQDPWIVFPGNIQGRHIREEGPKGCTLVTVESGEITQVEHYDLDVMRWTRCELDVSASETVDAIYEQVREGLQAALDTAEGRPVAVRLLLQGACSAHSVLHAERERWVQEYRALATGLGGAGIWLEKVSVKTKPSVSADEALERDDALSGLLRAIRDMELDASALDGLADEISSLRQKLPAELLSGDDPYDPTDSELLKNTLGDIKALLVNRLLSTERGA